MEWDNDDDFGWNLSETSTHGYWTTNDIDLVPPWSVGSGGKKRNSWNSPDSLMPPLPQTPDLAQIFVCFRCFSSLRKKTASLRAATKRHRMSMISTTANNFWWRKNRGSYFILIPVSLIKCCVKFSWNFLRLSLLLRLRLLAFTFNCWKLESLLLRTLNFCHWQKIFRFFQFSHSYNGECCWQSLN